jgi:serine/threonine-protein kinase
MGIDGPTGPSRVLNAWRLGPELGHGGTSTVYAATHVKTGTRAALKLLHPSLSGRPGVVKMLLAEARLVAAIDHPGTVKVLDEGFTEDGCAFLVFELLVGQTLEELRQERGGRVPIDEVMRIGDAAMDALRAVHEAGVVHRDVKPHNVFVLEGGGVKLLDFGFAKLRGYTADAAQDVFGTPSYMPPEQALGLAKKIDAQSDVWSLGATLFHVLSGQSVHIATHMQAMLLATSSARPRALSEAAPELSSKVAAVVDRALAYRKAERWPDMASMRAAWQEAHPHWLPTLPPPSFTTDPSYLDASLLESDSMRPPMRSLFDPRDLLNDSVPGQKHPGAIPVSIPISVGTLIEEPARRTRRFVQIAVTVAAALLVAISIASAMAMSSDAKHAQPNASHR